MRLLSGIILTIITTFIGYKISDKYRLRADFYKNFYEFNSTLINEISFSQRTLIEIIKDIKTESDFYMALTNYILEDKIKVNYPYLTNNEQEFIINYFKNIGSGDKASQSLYLEEINKKTKANFEKSNDELKKYRSLYIKLGFLVGLILLIILI